MSARSRHTARDPLAREAMNSETITYMILTGSGALSLGAFGYFIVAPAWGAYGRLWERLAASVLTLFVVAAFSGAGILIGLVIVYYWDSIIGVFGALMPLMSGMLPAFASGS
jgi:hypothetical protein